MAAPVLLLGLIFSLALLRIHDERDEAASGRDVKAVWVPALALLCFAYGLAVMAFFRANEANELSLISLIRHHTARSDCIVIVKNLDPETAGMAPRFDEIFDRRVLVADDLDHLPAGQGRIVILSALPAGVALDLLAQTATGGTGDQSRLHQAADWFNRSIARRQPGDRMDLAGAYFLYEPKP
jgi:hypothetical protein